MAGEEKVYTKGEMDLLVRTAEVKTMQGMLLKSFNAHKEEDSEHFGKLYSADEEILKEVRAIPEMMLKCKEGIKTEILTVARKEFTSVTDFKVFKTWIITGIIAGSVTGSAIATVISLFLKYSGVG